MQLARTLIGHMTALGTDIPERILRQVRLHTADAIAIGYAGARLPEGRPARKLLAACQAGGTRGASMVIGATQALPPALAAGVNAASMHVLDFDDIHDVARLHPTSVCLPAALAAGQVADVDDVTLVRAIALGVELMCRLGEAIRPTGSGHAAGWFLTQLLGYLGASLSAGIALGLTEDELVSSLGLAYMQAAGGKEAANGIGTDARGIYPAFAAMGGVQAALMAQAGVAGPETALDGRAGLFPLYLGAPLGATATERVLRRGAWAFSATEVKRWPSCRLSQPYIAAACTLRPRIADLANIRDIKVSINASAAKLCEPLDQRRRPLTLHDAKYSIPFMVAFALTHEEVGLHTLTESCLGDPAILSLTDRISLDPSLPDNPGHPPARIAVRTVDGTRIVSESVTSLALSEEALYAKFAGCLALAGLAGEIDAAWSAITDVQAQTSVLGTLARLQTATGAAAA
ncbi:MmgE/PrpD family protein [Cupriavidus sp. CuC1]|uniref:MmgE/PrpD family protein n=1 Tax=Cupriavidus sp. CuC1 TaxID=3373131 RepID=UPI0037D762C1